MFQQNIGFVKIMAVLEDNPLETWVGESQDNQVFQAISLGLLLLKDFKVDIWEIMPDHS